LVLPRAAHIARTLSPLCSCAGSDNRLKGLKLGDLTARAGELEQSAAQQSEEIAALVLDRDRLRVEHAELTAVNTRCRDELAEALTRCDIQVNEVRRMWRTARAHASLLTVVCVHR